MYTHAETSDSLYHHSLDFDYSWTKASILSSQHREDVLHILLTSLCRVTCVCTCSQKSALWNTKREKASPQASLLITFLQCPELITTAFHQLLRDSTVVTTQMDLFSRLGRPSKWICRLIWTAAWRPLLLRGYYWFLTLTPNSDTLGWLKAIILASHTKLVCTGPQRHKEGGQTFQPCQQCPKCCTSS